LSAVVVRLGRVGRWLVPSLAAACAGAVATGAAEVALGGRGGGALGATATIGFAAMLALPALLALSIVLRGVWAAWQPEALVAAATAPGGGAPALAGWLVTGHLIIAALGWAAYHGTWVIAVWTAFHPLVVGVLELGIMILATLGALLLSRPCARLFGGALGWLDARWRRRGWRTLLTPRRIVVALVALDGGVAAAVWLLVVAPRIGPFDLSPGYAPAVGVAIALLAHAVTRPAWPRARRVVGPLAPALAAAALAAAGAARLTSPATTLTIWGDQPLAGLAIDLLFDVDAIHDDLALAEPPPVARPGARHRDILLVTIDTTRSDHTPPYGGLADMPTLRELAQRGVVFEWAFAPSNVTRRSIPSMVIGAAPNRIRGRVVGWALRVDPRHVFVAERLAAGGYDTAGFMCCSNFWARDARTGLSRGLAHLEVETDNDGVKIAHDARTWLTTREAGHPPRPLFVWMHLLEPHNWLIGQPEPRTDADRRVTYDKALAAVDRMLAELLAPFAGRPPGEQPIVIITADHGEGLGDHGAPFHSTDLYNSQLRVPLILAGADLAPRRVPEVVSLTDLTPTILDLAGFVPPTGPGIDGGSFADLATGGRVGVAGHGLAFAAMIKDRSNPGGVSAVVAGRYKLIDRDGTLELYDEWTDPDEKLNVLAQHADIVAELRKLLALRLAASDRPGF
jgi:arylsulfatase A-like enzyme